MRFFIFSLLLNGFLSSISLARAADSLTIPETLSQLDNADASVWKISNVKNRGTGFFVEKKLFVTNAHIVLDMLETGSVEDIFLLQEKPLSILKVKQVVALSVFYDLALLETEEEVSHYLSFRGNALEPQENLFVPGYPDGIFKRIRKQGNILYENVQLYEFAVNSSDLTGISGSPVLDREGRLMGVASEGLRTTNILRAIKPNHLKSFIAGETGLSCLNSVNPRDCIKKEVENLKESAKEGSHHAQYILAFMYLKGQGLEPNLILAIFWYEEAAERGYALAQFSLANMYHKKQSLEQALFWYEEAAKLDYVPAQFTLASIYREGLGVEPNLELAIFWLERSADLGHAPSLSLLASLYYFGEEVEQDLTKAFPLSSKAAKQEDAVAQMILGIMYFYGEETEADPKLAIFWLERSAEQGFSLSRTVLVELTNQEQYINQEQETFVYKTSH